MSISARLLPLLFAASALPLSQVLFPGCATIIDGPRQRVSVKTQPAGAQVYLNGRLIGNTPATLVVSRWGLHRIRIEMPGYQPLELPLEKRFNGNAGGNLYIGGGWIVVDALTGAIFQLDVPAKAKADVRAQALSEGIFGPETLTISTTLKPDPAAHRVGQMERR
jgi:hypothetical protein